MVIVRLEGGLGNQMFQYAAGYAIAKRRDDTLCIDITPLVNYSPISVFKAKYDKREVLRKYELGIFPITGAIASYYDLRQVLGLDSFRTVRRFKRFVNKLFGRKILKDSSTVFHEVIGARNIEEIDKIKGDIYLWGDFQSPDYFKEIEAEIRQQFSFEQFTVDFGEKIHQHLKEIESTESVGVHVRRTDYVTRNDQIGLCTLDYYKNAIELMKSKVKNPKFYLFSDDVEWCKTEFSKISPDIIIYDNKDLRQNVGTDMLLMSRCKHNIIANSSYSWWSAWLNSNPSKIVVAPDPWFNDRSLYYNEIVPKSYLKVSRSQ